MGQGDTCDWALVRTSDMYNKDAALLVVSSLRAACMGVAGGDFLAIGAFLFGLSVEDPASAAGGLVPHGASRNNAHSQNLMRATLYIPVPTSMS